MTDYKTANYVFYQDFLSQEIDNLLQLIIDSLSQELIIAKKFPTITQCQCTRLIVNLASTLWAPNKLIFWPLLRIIGYCVAM